MQPAGLRVETTQNAERPRYRPIGEYGVIGDCRTAALIGPDGSIDWCCMPHFDSPAIFLRLLDADKGGYFQVRPAAGFVGEMAYLPATNMLQTIFTTSTGKLRLIDCMPIRPRQPRARRTPHRNCASTCCIAACMGYGRASNARSAMMSPRRTASCAWPPVSKARWTSPSR